MKKIILSLGIFLVIIGCATSKKEEAASAKVLQKFRREYVPIDAKDFKYETKQIAFSYVPTNLDSQIKVTFLNKIQKPIKIIWDETSFINPSGGSEKIIHEGIKLRDSGSATMTPTLIPPGSNIADSISPISRVTWLSNRRVYLPICGGMGALFVGLNLNDLEEDESCVGKVFAIFVTYEIEGKKSSFTVKYKLNKRILETELKP
jgi:hypothetical protein